MMELISQGGVDVFGSFFSFCNSPFAFPLVQGLDVSYYQPLENDKVILPRILDS